MAWVKVPPENHPKFLAALPGDKRVETMKMFGGVAAKVNGQIFAGLFGRSTMLLLPEPDRAEALALEGASLFDPMGNGRVRSDKVMLPERLMDAPAELRRWIARAFQAAAGLPAKAAAKKPAKRPAKARGAATIDDYLANVRPKSRAALQVLRKTIRTIVPKAEECLSYGIPAFRLDDRIVAGFSATSEGCSYYPFSGSTFRTLAKDLARYDKTRGALHFGLDEPLPPALVRKLIQTRSAERPKAATGRRRTAR